MIAMFNVMVVAIILGVFVSKYKTNVRSPNLLNGSPYETSAAEEGTEEATVDLPLTEVDADENDTESTGDVDSNETDSETSNAKKPVTDKTITIYQGELPAIVSSRAGTVSQLARETCNSNEALTTLELITDGYAGETSWEINRPDGTQLAFGPPTGQTYGRMTSYVGELCLPVGRNILVIKDVAGDGE